MMPYIINTGLILTGCLAFYKIFLQKETFYRLNRSVLLVCLLFAFLLPLVPVPKGWSFRKTSSEQTSIKASEQLRIPLATQTPVNGRAFKKRSDAWISPPEATSPLSRQATISAFEPQLSFSQLVKYAAWLYWFGVAVFALNFLFQLGILLIRAYSYPVVRDGKLRIVEVGGNQAPCSFLNNIFIDASKYDWNTYQQILLHEKVHVNEKHSLDILLAELVLIFQWFNPFAWVYRRELENNLEFLTDETVLETGNMEICSYQMSLLRVSATHLPLSLTTNYNQSLLKKRIAMMNAKKSNLNTSWKYFFLLPMFAMFACFLNEPQAQDKTTQKNTNKSANTNKSTKTTKATKSTNKESSTDAKNSSNGVNATNANRNEDEDNNSNNNSNSNSNRNNNNDHDGIATEGYWYGTITGDEIKFQFTKKEKKDPHSYSGAEFKLSEFPNLPRGVNGDFSLRREAGTLHFNGKFEGQEGMGKYKFDPDRSYADYMNQQGFSKLDDEELFVFFLVDVSKSLLQMLADEGYTKLKNDELIAIAALNIDKTFIAALKENGYTNVEPEQLVALKAMDINGAYIKEIKDAGYKDITAEQLISFKAQGIDKAYLARVPKITNDNEKLDADEVVSLKAMDIDEHYAEQFRQVGYTNIPREHLISMKAVGVTPEFIKSFKAIGYTNIGVENLVAMKSLNVTPEFLKSFESLGYKQIEADELISLKSLGVTPEFIKGFSTVGYKDIPLEQVVSLKATGVTPSYIKQMKAKGFNYNNVEKYVTLKSLTNED